MISNGLLKYYRSLPHKNGFLDVSSFLHNSIPTRRRGATKRFIEGKPYYLKDVANPSWLQNLKYTYDAEILLSQLYAKLGFDTATYIPATNGDNNFLISNDISSKNVITATEHLYPYFGQEIRGVTFLRPLPFLTREPRNLEIDPTEILTLEAMRQQTKMRIVDVASYNDDRHSSNFFYKVVPAYGILSEQNLTIKQRITSLFSKPRHEIESIPAARDALMGFTEHTSRDEILQYYRDFNAQDISLIDYGASGNNLFHLVEGRDAPDVSRTYDNEFGFQDISSREFKDKIVESEQLAELVDKHELAEQIGSVDPIATAKDITRTIGYQFDDALVDTLASSFDEMAETLML